MARCKFPILTFISLIFILAGLIGFSHLHPTRRIISIKKKELCKINKFQDTQLRIIVNLLDDMVVASEILHISDSFILLRTEF